ncbi:MAG: Arm DNA-binding domain-containing protein, partial [Pseudomonadota bacterium]
MANELLTAKEVSEAITKGRISDGGGLYLDVKASGAKAWVFVWRGKRWQTPSNKSGRREMGLGKFGTENSGLITLKKARELAAKCRALLNDGIDPKKHRDEERTIAKREAEKDSYTFGSIALEYIEAHEPTWRNKSHIRQWRFTVLGNSSRKNVPDYCKSIRHLQIDQITREHILGILKPIWHTKTETAERLQSRLERI